MKALPIFYLVLSNLASRKPILFVRIPWNLATPCSSSDVYISQAVSCLSSRPEIADKEDKCFDTDKQPCSLDCMDDLTQIETVTSGYK